MPDNELRKYAREFIATMNQKNKAVISCDAWHAFVNLEAVLSTPEISSQGILDNSTPEPSREPNSSATLTRSDHFSGLGKMVSDNSEPSRGVTPDMFWDADDAEHTASHSIEDLLELVADDMRNGDGYREIEVMCGMSLPNITIKVWVEGDELKWEEIDAAIAKEPKS
jgi:hypothetical protein